MKIAVCDDSMEDLLKIEKLLLKYRAHHPDRDFELEKFPNPSRLYHKISEGEMADLYLLDMLMPQRTGVDIGKQIRKCGGENVIIYITSSDDYALDAYSVHAIRYLLKPVQEEKLFEALDYGLSYTKIKKEPVYLVRTKNGLAQVPYSKIEYIENASRKLEVHLSNGEVLNSLFIRGTFEEELKEMEGQQNFLQIHKSFFINLDYVKQLTRDGMVMECGKQLPVSKAKAQKVKREYLLFVSGKCRSEGE